MLNGRTRNRCLFLFLTKLIKFNEIINERWNNKEEKEEEK